MDDPRWSKGDGCGTALGRPHVIEQCSGEPYVAVVAAGPEYFTRRVRNRTRASGDDGEGGGGDDGRPPVLQFRGGMKGGRYSRRWWRHMRAPGQRLLRRVSDVWSAVWVEEPVIVSQGTFTHLEWGAQTLTGPSTPQIGSQRPLY